MNERVQLVVLTERSDVTPAVRAPRCRVSTCWHTAVEDELCLGHAADAYRHASHGCPDEDTGCPICDDTPTPEVQAEAQRLEAQIQKDEEAWTRAFQLTNPIDAFVGDVQ